ncbi:SecDF P1 head subdomain-containing protein [Candidimonas nitroreducens]|uniref:SecDF P1 head subdomain-containing protein n=1 Tax=Candidimonas nitroreducens TaxID=683354 RepID=UPI0018E958CE|nr:hypothetical protein [Candidimonas nitroreducens]
MEFRLAQAQPANNLMPLPIGKRLFYYFPVPVLTGADLDWAVPRKTGQGQPFVHIKFNQKGAQRLAELTQRNKGRWLLITVNGNLEAGPRIGDPIDNGIIDMATNTDSEAARFAGELNGSVHRETSLR